MAYYIALMWKLIKFRGRSFEIFFLNLEFQNCLPPDEFWKRLDPRTNPVN